MNIVYNFRQEPLYWSPRYLGLFGVILTSIFAFDVVGEYSGLEILIALLMHLVPTLILGTAVIVGWKNDLYGSIIFLFLFILSMFFFRTYEEIIVFLIISFPLFVIGELFFLNWYKTTSRYRSRDIAF